MIVFYHFMSKGHQHSPYRLKREMLVKHVISFITSNREKTTNQSNQEQNKILYIFQYFFAEQFILVL